MNLTLNKKALYKLKESIDLNKRILEVGPLKAPLFQKNDANIYYADIYNTFEIKTRFSVDNPVPIDFVIKDGYENTFKNISMKFDYILSNNVLEHIPNPIGTLLDMAKVLNEHGKIGLLLPDREFSIDYHRENTSFVDWYDVFVRGEENNTPRLALDFKLNHTDDRNPRHYWKTDIKEYPNSDIDACLKKYNSLIDDFDNNYFDEHYWAFTDRSFLRIIINLLKINIFPFKLVDFYPTAFNDNVFGVMLELNHDILDDEDQRLNQIVEIRDIIKFIDDQHFRINCSELIRENNRLKQLLKSFTDLTIINCSADEFFEKSTSLKKTVKGLNGYLFLINDGNSELKQHFDRNYKTIHFNPESFIKYFNIKKRLFEMKNISSYFFIVPDKSVVCKELLPFEHNTFFRRNYDYFKDLFPDFSGELDYYDYYKCDTHMKHSGGRKLAFKILNYINPSFTIDQFNAMIAEYNYDDKPLFDLVSDMNWSYSDEELRKYDSTKYSDISHNSLTEITDTIPVQFKSGTNNRLSYYYKNHAALYDKKVLIFHDSSIHALKNFLIPYFKESLFYWDHLNLDKDIIEWFKPDVVIEIRIERFLENYSYPDWIIRQEQLL